MFDSIKRYFKKEKPAFNVLQAFPHKDKYFYRVAAWDWLTDKHIHVYDPHNPRLITMDDWPQLIFLDANGKLTVTEYVDYMATCYGSKIPNELDQTIINELTTLLDMKLIKFANTQVKLEAKFETPISAQKDLNS
ncbi:MAG: hypothetical protein EOO85_25225 [Pedobacter sp.]|nr:MAG: hypothetical protein EOO85_25225 [Pedobacter sp.]